MDYSKVVNSIVSLNLPLSKIILFGSVARGENTIESDIDIGIVMTESVTNPQRRMITKAVSEFETLESLFDINCFYTTDEDLKTATHWSNPCVDMREEGVILWQK